jgi:hypothetical protein
VGPPFSAFFPSTLLPIPIPAKKQGVLRVLSVTQMCLNEAMVHTHCTGFQVLPWPQLLPQLCHTIAEIRMECGRTLNTHPSPGQICLFLLRDEEPGAQEEFKKS